MARRRTESGWESGMRFGGQLADLAAPFIRAKELKDARAQQLQDQELRRSQQLEDREYNRNSQFEDLQRKFQMEQALGKLSGARFTPINPAQGGRPASIGALPVNPNDPQDLMVAAPGTFISPSEAMAGEEQRFVREQRLKELLNPQTPKGFNLSPGEQRFEYDQESKGFKSIASAPGKDAKNETFTLSPGQKVFDSSGNVIASIDPTEKGSKTTTVSPGSIVIDEAGNKIFENPLNPKEQKQSAGDISFETNVKTFQSKSKELSDLVTKFGNVEGGMPWSDPTATAKLQAANYQLAIMYAKIVDPDSVAREGEVAAAQKYLIPTGWLTRNKTTLAAIKNMQDTVDEYQTNRKEAKSSAIGGPDQGIGRTSGGSNVVEDLFNKYK